MLYSGVPQIYETCVHWMRLVYYGKALDLRCRLKWRKVFRIECVATYFVESSSVFRIRFTVELNLQVEPCLAISFI